MQHHLTDARCHLFFFWVSIIWERIKLTSMENKDPCHVNGVCALRTMHFEDRLPGLGLCFCALTSMMSWTQFYPVKIIITVLNLSSLLRNLCLITIIKRLVFLSRISKETWVILESLFPSLRRYTCMYIEKYREQSGINLWTNG